MRYGLTIPARPSPYDRAIAKVASGADIAGVAPHGSTQRASYTVPAGRRFKYETLQLWMQRQTAAAPVGQMSVMHSPSSFLGVSAFLPFLRMTDNTVFASKEVYLTEPFNFEAGSILASRTEDLSTGGTAAYYMMIYGQEYGA